MSEVLAGNGGLMAIAQDLAAGSLGGMAGLVFGHPLDVVKTRMQAASSPLRSLSAHECLVRTCVAEGWHGLYRGIAPPLLAVALYQSTVFAAYEWSFQRASQMGAGDAHARWAAAIFSGAASCLVTVPTDAVKIQLQLELSGSDGALHDAARCARQLVATRGTATLFRGMVPCLLRDVPATVLYFEAYTFTKRAFLRQLGTDADWRAELMAGGAAGVASWGSILPLDVIKTVSQEAAAQGRQLGTLQAAAEVRRRDGLRGFFRGGVPIVVRSFPVNAITFMVYERAKLFLGLPSSL